MINRRENKTRERVFIDTAGPHPKNTGEICYYMCDLYYFMDMSWLHFEKIKSERITFVSNLLGVLKGKESRLNIYVVTMQVNI